jgi:ribosomal protein S18 acetylase RimI-like enzyme
VLGHRSLVLQSDEDLTAAHAFYERLGFVRRPELDEVVDERYRAFGYELALDE